MLHKRRATNVCSVRITYYLIATIVDALTSFLYQQNSISLTCNPMIGLEIAVFLPRAIIQYQSKKVLAVRVRC